MSVQSFELLCFMHSKKVVFQLVCELGIENFNRRWETIKNFGVIESKQLVWILEVRSEKHCLTVFV